MDNGWMCIIENAPLVGVECLTYSYSKGFRLLTLRCKDKHYLSCEWFDESRFLVHQRDVKVDYWMLLPCKPALPETDEEKLSRIKFIVTYFPGESMKDHLPKEMDANYILCKIQRILDGEAI